MIADYMLFDPQRKGVWNNMDEQELKKHISDMVLEFATKMNELELHMKPALN